ncbi:MarR family winged helix-turn-helix transcriptional regulator [Verrucosispora sp. WMMA2044]|uniref:Winged helix-turn-helix transcriptional regulator n=1 Tax=Verrucosispora sioxanthis TaxID=2499994 RepID=A0A6M1KRV2_9ACTN|nr:MULTISPECIES: MarR family winged helix-turn-helix transcriptional regulator [Micromonospora]NEE63558.1 winged helix-turn-helix transcriptional regulator [Verrucosispora sioxanthis]NGM12668.1 winged helix-turn-helix transcriptional regulator [Verrucosispora sioxanthis]WBB48044.1 MarR family winged helix-turn-helix transcriptional regulator [Verrucosispora sp. WMMA2044]
MPTPDPPRPGFVLPLLLLAGFRTLIDDLHAELARQGHPELRPLHGFVLQAVGTDGTTASELGNRLGVSKQAAGKTVDRLVALGYLERADDPRDARRKLVRLTPYGLDGLRRSAVVFDELRQRWTEALGADRVAAIEDDLRRVTPANWFRLDIPGWFTG